MTTIIRKFEWDMGHRLLKHNGKCRRLHGHRYVLEAEFTCEEMTDGMVIDFGILKTLIGDQIDNRYDHRTMLESHDPLIQSLDNDEVVVVNFPPTAENIAGYLGGIITGILDVEKVDRIKLASLRLWETPKCSTIWIADV